MKSDIVHKISYFLAELIGTALLVFIGCMGCVDNLESTPTHLNIVLNFGLAVMMIIQIFGCVSGAHINPAVTAAALIYKLITPLMAALYVIAQVIGGFVGFGLLKAVMPSKVFEKHNATEHGLCSTIPHKEIHPAQALAIEFIITMVLIFVCCGIWDPRNSKCSDSAPLKFGLTIAGLACAAGPYTGASMNPARSFGPAVWNGDFEHHWIYWIGPLTAGFLTTFLYKSIFCQNFKVDKPLRSEEYALSAVEN